MDVVVVGVGYVGLTTAACLAALGHRVHGCDTDAEKVAALQQGRVPFHEPGLTDLLAGHRSRLSFSSELNPGFAPALYYICVGTPQGSGGQPELTALWQAVERIVDQVEGQPVVAVKSTVPVGTCRRIQERCSQAGLGARVVSNPEFLREGTAVRDFFHPDRTLIGAADRGAGELVAQLFHGIQASVVMTSWEAAELTKWATNAFLATRITFVNELAALCDALGVDVLEVTHALGLDHRVGRHFLQPGPGYGGSCLPKDLAALIWQAGEAGVQLDLLTAVPGANARQRSRAVEKLKAGLQGLGGETVAVWGLAFKAGTDDLRAAPALEILTMLAGAGARVQAYDPQAASRLKHYLDPAVLQAVSLAPGPLEAAAGSDALLILTEWDEFRAVEPAQLRSALRGDLVVDCRNVLDPERMRAAGFRYCGVGRGERL